MSYHCPHPESVKTFTTKGFDMKNWIGLVAMTALIISSAMVVWAGEKKSGSTDMSHSSETK
jgi:hypothetical protein